MKKENIKLFLFILVVGIAWGMVYWLFIAPDM